MSKAEKKFEQRWQKQVAKKAKADAETAQMLEDFRNNEPIVRVIINRLLPSLWTK